MSIRASMHLENDEANAAGPSARLACFLSATIALAALASPALAEDDHRRFNPNGRYCFADGSGKVNVLSGDHDGFYADPIGRAGNSLYYERVGRTDRYVSPTGAFYTFFDGGKQVRWTGGSTIVVLFKC